MSHSTTMRSPASAILWEIWTANRFGFATVLGVIPICALGAHHLATLEWNGLWAQAARIPFGCSVLAVFLFFNFTEPSRANKLAVFPVRLFAMPVKTSTMVAVPMLSGAAFVALLYVVWAKLVFAPLEPGTPVVVPALLLSTGLMSCLAVMWGLPGLRLGRLLLLGAIGAVLLWGLVFPDALLPGWLASASPLVQTTFKGGACGLISLGAFGWAWVSIEKQRYVRTRSRRPDLAAQIADVGRAQSLLAFASPAMARNWLEWRRQGWLLPMTVLVLGLFAAGPLALFVDLDAGSSLKLVGWLLLLPLALASLLGKMVAVPDFWSRELLLPPFVALRPQSCGEIVFDRIRLAGISAVLSWVLLAACAVGAVGIWGDSSLLQQHAREFRQNHATPVQMLILALGFGSLVLLTWRQLIVSLYLRDVWTQRAFCCGSHFELRPLFCRLALARKLVAGSRAFLLRSTGSLAWDHWSRHGVFHHKNVPGLLDLGCAYAAPTAAGSPGCPVLGWMGRWHCLPGRVVGTGNPRV